MEEAMKEISRRAFIQKAIAAGAALAALPAATECKGETRKAERKVIVHPNVDNLRVVGITDQAMTTGHEPASTWATQEKLVDRKAVWENIDRLACSLCRTGDPASAWRTIFMKPPGKSWSDTIVAIKTNNIAQQHTRSAVIAKICHSMTSVLGVKPENIHIYDARHGGSITRNTPFQGLPEGCRIENDWGGSDAYTSIPGPWKGGKEKAKCLR